MSAPAKRARLDSPQAEDLAQSEAYVDNFGRTDVRRHGLVPKTSGVDRDAALRARQLVWTGDQPQETFADAFWSHHIALAELDYPCDGEMDDRLDEDADCAVAAAPRLTDWKAHTLPLARIKKVAKLDESVKMLASEVPVLLAHACEVFIAELTTRAWIVATQSKRKTLSRTDIADAAAQTETLDFLIDVLGRDGGKQTGAGIQQEEDLTQLGDRPDSPRRRPVDLAAVAREEEHGQDGFLGFASGAQPDDFAFLEA